MADDTQDPVSVEEHEKTFEGFIKAVTWSVVIILLLLVFLALVGA